MTSIHDLPDWPQFTWDHPALFSRLSALRYRQGKLLGRLEGLAFDLRLEAMLRTLTSEVVKSSEIAGEPLDTECVRARLAQHLGLNIDGVIPSDHHLDGIVEMTLDATQAYDEPLTAERLLRWHAALFSTGRSDMSQNTVEQRRACPMTRDAEMARFLAWFQKPPETDPIIHAAIAHLWFITIRPFDDGNRRIARAITDMALARSEGSAQRFYSMSTEIWQERRAYGDMLVKTQRAGLDITDWLIWFLNCLDRAFDGAEIICSSVFQKAHFWETYRTAKINDRQRDMLNRLLDGFVEQLTTSTYAKMAKCSQDTAYRDILALIDLGALQKEEPGGRSTCYSLILADRDAT